jgi:FKBP-type peptidyl-prolyl cis-trans isomerase (trigger factor)
MFGEEVEEKSLLDIQRERVKSARYEDRVKEFTSRIKPLAAMENNDDDYYATKMLNATRRQSDEQIDSPLSQSMLRQYGTPEVKSLTLKTLSRNYCIEY